VLIDWFTVIAQIINFLILVALLKHFLFNPIVSAMNERREKIDSSIDDAKKREEEAHEQLQLYRQKNREFDEKRNQLLLAAEEEAKKRGDEFLEQARKQAEADLARLQDAMSRKKRDIAERLRIMSLHDASSIAESAISEITNTPIEEGLVHVFIAQLKKIEGARKNQLAAEVRKGKTPTVVKSSFDLSEDLRRKLSDAITKEFPESRAIQYQRISDGVLGIEMTIDGYKLRWGVEQFLGDLEDQVSKVITDAFGSRQEARND
jgi:F-type H+-transporting ATPase subunit b